MVVFVLNIHEVLDLVYREEIYVIFKRDKPLGSGVLVLLKPAEMSELIKAFFLETSCQ